MPLTKVTRNGQVTIPMDLRREVGIEEGDLIELRAVGDHIELVPKRLIDKNQTFFWTPEWQAAEREAQADVEAGRVEEYSSIEDLLNDLHSQT